MDFWTSANAPWWLSVVTLLIGLFGAHFTTKHADQRRFEVEEKRLAQQRRTEREQYLANRTLDEISLLVAAAESLRLRLVSGMMSVDRDEDGEVADTAENVEFVAELYAQSDEEVHKMLTHVGRSLMITDGLLKDAIHELDKGGREFYVDSTESSARLSEVNDAFSSAIAEVIVVTRSEVGTLSAA